MLRAGIGVPDFPVKIDGVARWRSVSDVARHYQVGRVFIAGDAAHVMPPNGGFGGNTGIADAHNIAWKLALVLKGIAGPELLATYEQERRPVGKLTVEQAYTRYVTRSATYLGAKDYEPQVNDFNIELGYLYHSPAIIAEDDDTAIHADPRETFGRPGSRAPHLWIQKDGKRVSTLDLFGAASRCWPRRRVKPGATAAGSGERRGVSHSTPTHSDRSFAILKIVSPPLTGLPRRALCLSGPTDLSLGARNRLTVIQATRSNELCHVSCAEVRRKAILQFSIPCGLGDGGHPVLELDGRRRPASRFDGERVAVHLIERTAHPRGGASSENPAVAPNTQAVSAALIPITQAFFHMPTSLGMLTLHLDRRAPSSNLAVVFSIISR